MASSAPTKIAKYLFRRLRQLGIGAIHGVPGDFNLALLDHVEPEGLLWVGNANELNAGYAADAYARIKGIGALVTTFGVGELSAINSIAGAFSERAAVVHIVGVPPRATQERCIKVHHTFNDGNFTRFAEMHRHVTVAQTKLWDPHTSAEQIDSALQQCLLHSRPVYIEVPVDLVDVTIDSSRLSQNITLPAPVIGDSFDVTLERVLERIRDAKQPAIVADGEIRAMRIVDDIQTISESSGWPTWVTGYSKGLLDETLPNFHGIFRGRYDTPEAQNFLQTADLVLFFGPHLSSTNTFLYSSIPNADKTISFYDTNIALGNNVIPDVPAACIVPRIAEVLKAGAHKHVYQEYPNLPKDQIYSFADTPKAGLITQDKLWRLLGNFLRPGDVVMGETGTAGYGVRDLLLPQHAKLFGPVTWLSIGYMLPAAQGAALARRELGPSDPHSQNTRVVLLMGDGSFQMTAQELSTIIRHNLDVVVFLINNDGYTIERCIHGLNEGYNDVARWNYLRAPHFFGASEDSFTASAKTWGELDAVLKDDRLANGPGLRMVEVFMDREDAPIGPLKEYLVKQRESFAK